MNIPNEKTLKSIDIVIKYFFEYNNYTKTSSIKNNGLHAGHLAILLALNELIPPNEANDYWVSQKCIEFQAWKTLNYTASQQTFLRDLTKLVNLGILKKGKTNFKFSTYQYNL